LKENHRFYRLWLIGSSRQQPETGYNIWDFKGQDLQKHPLEKFKQFVWRPRPATLLSKDDQKRVRKNLREFSKLFDEEDAAEETNVSATLLSHRKRLIDEWNAWRNKRVKELLAEKQKSGEDREEKVDDGELETVEEVVEDILEESEEVVE
jgi:translation initiation factor 3 subunit B